MTDSNDLLHKDRVIARVVLELTSPLSISTGDAGDDADNALVCDANGLPAIPGTSLAGVLRSAWAPTRGALGKDRKGAAFGYQDKAPSGVTPEAMRSLVRVSWGAIHDASDKPVEPRRPADAIDDDVLTAARVPIVRDHVRLDHRGTVDGTGKYTRASVMAGHRFTVELETSGRYATKLMTELIEVLGDPATRLGGRTRAGLGAFRLVRYARRDYDLSVDGGDLNDWIERSLSLREPLKGAPVVDVEADDKAVPPDTLALSLVPTEPWQIGAGDEDSLGDVQNAQPDDEHYRPDIVPYTEERIVWKSGTGKLSAPQLVLPASAIKGALRHRTAFYLRLADEDFAHTKSDDPHWRAGELPGIKALFGEINGAGQGQVGLLFIDDVRLDLPPKGLLASTHVSIDRFTGAPMNGHLFTDISVDSDTPLPVRLRLDFAGVQGAFLNSERVKVQRVKRPDASHEDTRAHLAEALKAFKRAVTDLCTESLQLGAGAGRGYGYFKDPGAQVDRWLAGVLKEGSNV